MTKRMRGKIALMEMLRAEGVRYVFGNPGTSEAPILDALERFPDIEYVLTVQEGAAMGMADGYARATNAPSVVNLHIHSGLANGISLLSDAYSAGVPIVLTAGNTDIRKLGEGRTDLTEMVAPFTKWRAEVTHADQVSSLVRRAFTVARTPPAGPVFLSFSANALEGEGQHEIVPSSDSFAASSPDPVAVEQAAKAFADAERPTMVVGSRLAESGAEAVAAAVRVAELIGARVYSSGYTRMVFPSSHPQYVGMLSMRVPDMRARMHEVDAVLAVGVRPFADTFYFPDPPLAESAKLVHIDSAADELGRAVPTDVAMLADPGAALSALGDALEAEMSGAAMESAKARATAIGEETRAVQEAFEAAALVARGGLPMSPGRLMMEVADALPPESIVVEDAISSRGALYSAIKFSELGSIEAEVGAAIGWGMGAGLGVTLAHPDRPVVTIVGDGSAMMTVQALWTAANMGIPAVYVVCNNGMYRVLKLNMNTYLRDVAGEPDRQSGYLGMDFPLPFDLARVAESFGVRGQRIEAPEEIGPALSEALDAGEPALLDVVIDGSL